MTLAVVGALSLLLIDDEEFDGLEMWVFADIHYDMYKSKFEEWNQDNSPPARALLIGLHSVRRRLMSAFYAGTPAADLVEITASESYGAFRGPLEAVGYTDLTDRLREEGLLEKINSPSFTPWTYRGRIFGLPHDVHPVLLCYRADIIEEAGIDITKAETWDEYIELVRPLLVDLDGDGYRDRFALEILAAIPITYSTFFLQAGGRIFDDNLQPVMGSDINARVLAHLAIWLTGPDRIAAELESFSAQTSLKRIIDGNVLAFICPDWRAQQFRRNMPTMKGKFKIIPLPAWEPGGRRTSVIGGTMLAIPRSNIEKPSDFEIRWKLAKLLYANPETAKKQWQEQGILSPLKSIWDDPVFDQPDEYYSNQPLGRIYINAAPDVPIRTASPYLENALREAMVAGQKLRVYAENINATDPDQLVPEAKRLLEIADENVLRRMQRNIYHAQK